MRYLRFRKLYHRYTREDEGFSIETIIGFRKEVYQEDVALIRVNYGNREEIISKPVVKYRYRIRIDFRIGIVAFEWLGRFESVAPLSSKEGSK